MGKYVCMYMYIYIYYSYGMYIYPDAPCMVYLPTKLGDLYVCMYVCMYIYIYIYVLGQS
jgi:hypothetical protein